jgi:hypothetical protein
MKSILALATLALIKLDTEENASSEGSRSAGRCLRGGAGQCRN